MVHTRTKLPTRHHNKERSSPPQHHTRKARPPQHRTRRARPPQTKSKCNVVVTTTKNRGQLLLAGEAPTQTKHIPNVGVSNTSVHVEAIRSNLHNPPTCQGAHRTRLSERRQSKACKTRNRLGARHCSPICPIRTIFNPKAPAISSAKTAALDVVEGLDPSRF